jgi:hypothetical protein
MSQIIVTVTEKNISCLALNQAKQVLSINNIDTIEIRTTGEGPCAPDLFFVLKAGPAEMLIPQGAIGFESDKAFDFFKQFEGFDYEQMVASITCTELKIFNCWEKK